MVSNSTIDEALEILVETGLIIKDNEGRYKLTPNGQRYAIASSAKGKNAKQ